MGINKFLDDSDELKIPEKNYKKKVDNVLKTKFEDEVKVPNLNLIDNLNKQSKRLPKKVPMSLYFNEDDLLLLKAISELNDTTVNKTIMSILELPLKVTRENLPLDFDIKKLAEEYDKNSKKKKV
ncbi:hypothetical protein [Romboutsia lituseburensis]|uniref:hypothetical protein n=1 Tax=Romboutsia lituseburensis TaxID=1537 RepID=UPI0022EAAC8C|nr:hypothetical protein [Romboutsia lituseburensis]